MIDLKELRVGNSITYKSAADTDEVIEVSINSLYRIDEDPNGYDPIKLSVDWLVKLGLFEKGNDGHGYFYVIERSAHKGDEVISFRVRHHESSNTFRVVMGEFGVITCVNLKYVHQVQNLYNCICGKELQVKTTLKQTIK